MRFEEIFDGERHFIRFFVHLILGRRLPRHPPLRTGQLQEDGRNFFCYISYCCCSSSRSCYDIVGASLTDIFVVLQLILPVELLLLLLKEKDIVAVLAAEVRVIVLLHMQL